MFIVNPLSGKGLMTLFSTHPPIEERVKRHKEMAGRM
jgi:heat shock protein HtpX